MITYMQKEVTTGKSDVVGGNPSKENALMGGMLTSRVVNGRSWMMLPRDRLEGGRVGCSTYIQGIA